jgi:hypothetical protein
MRTVEIPGPPKNIPLSRQFHQVDVKTEIQGRIASFRAHQERFNRERQEYFSATLARLRASIEQLPPPSGETQRSGIPRPEQARRPSSPDRP